MGAFYKGLWYTVCGCILYSPLCGIAAAPVLARRGGLLNLWLKNLHIYHIICLTGQPEGERESPAPAQVNTAIRNSHPTFTREQDGYFLFFRFRIATIRRPVVSIIMNSSYVLISFPPSARLGTGESTSPGCPGKHIILSGCGCCRSGRRGVVIDHDFVVTTGHHIFFGILG